VKERIIEICDKKQFVGLLVRVSAAHESRWGAVKSLMVKGEALILRFRMREYSFESSMRLDSAVIREDDDGMIFITGRRNEWKFYAYVMPPLS
jgi:hypothetical protein